jgi:hypothetical protein
MLVPDVDACDVPDVITLDPIALTIAPDIVGVVNVGVVIAGLAIVEASVVAPVIVPEPLIVMVMFMLLLDTWL